MAMVFTHETVNGPINRLICTWTSDGSGDAAGTTTFPINGLLIKGITDPDGTDAPSPNYDIVVTGGGVNVLASTTDDLVDRHTSNTEEVYFLLTAEGDHPLVADLLTVTVANAGITKAGVLYLYYLKQANV